MGLFGFKALKILPDSFPKPDSGENYNAYFYSPYQSQFQWKIGEMNTAECFMSKSNKRLMIYNKKFDPADFARPLSPSEIAAVTNFGIVEYDAEITPCPHEENRCGIYASWDSSTMTNQTAYIITLIEAFGKIIPADRGFRANRARIRAIWHIDYQRCQHIKNIDQVQPMSMLNMQDLVITSKIFYGV